MATYVVDAQLKLSTETISGEVLDDGLQSIDSDSTGVERLTIAPAAFVEFTGGVKGTWISTNIAAVNSVDITFLSVTKLLGSFLYLPGGMGTIRITNTLTSDINIVAAIIN